jgi:formylglycine-generating enzyme required for sulfatase activity
VSRPFERLIMKNLSKQADLRNASAAEFLAELGECSDILHSDILVQRRKTGRLLPALAGGVVLGAVIVLLALLDPFSMFSNGSPQPGPSGTPGPSNKAPDLSDEEAEKKYQRALEEGRQALEAGDAAAALEAFQKARQYRNNEELASFIQAARFQAAVALAEKAIEDKDFVEARKHAFAAKRSAPTPEDDMRANELLTRADKAVRKSESIYQNAVTFESLGEVLKAVPLLEEYTRDYPKGEKFEEAGKKLETLRKNLENVVGLVVTSNPPGAAVMLDEKEVGKTPLLLADPGLGSHTLVLDLKGYQLTKGDVEYEGGKKEFSFDLTAGAYGALRVVGDESITVAYRGTDYGPLPQNIPGVPPGKGEVRVTGPGGAAYDIPFESVAGKPATLTVDFEAWEAREEETFRTLTKGDGLESCRTLFQGFLDAFPSGKHNKTVRDWLARVEEEASFAETLGAGDAESQLEAARKYLRKYENATYPNGWLLSDARKLVQTLEKGRDDKTFASIVATSTLPGRKQACEKYIEGFPEGAHREEVTRLYAALKEEETLVNKFDYETRFGEKLALGRRYLDSFPSGFEAERLGRELSGLEEEENLGFEAAFAVKNPEELLRLGSAYLGKYTGAEREGEVLKAVRNAKAELEALEACGTEEGCREYLDRHPEGFYARAVTDRYSRFGWRNDEARGISQPRVLPPGLAKGGEPGEYASDRDGAVMVFVPGGIFPLGTDDYYADREQRPRIYVYTGSFFIDKYEVTNEKFGRFLEWSRTADDPLAFSHPLEREVHPDGKDRTPDCWDDPRFNRPDLPVVGIDWFDAWAYSHWAGKTLPSEAQWEIAASCNPHTRKKAKYPWGDEDPTLSRAVWDARRPLAVGERDFGASPYGVRDMAGNVAEWCLDAWAGDRWESIKKKDLKYQEWVLYKPLLFAVDASATDETVLHFRPSRAKWAVRGGSWNDGKGAVRTVSRCGAWGRSDKIGFRCVFVPRKGK